MKRINTAHVSVVILSLITITVILCCIFFHPPAIETTLNTSGAVGDFYVTILPAQFFNDAEGNDCVKITYRCKNITNDAHTINYIFYTEVTQRGNECYRVNIESVDGFYLVNPGEICDFSETYRLTDDSDVTVQVRTYNDNRAVVEVFKVK